MSVVIRQAKKLAKKALVPYWKKSPIENLVLNFAGNRRSRQRPQLSPVSIEEILEKVTQGGIEHFAIPSSSGNFLRIGIPANNVDRLLIALKGLGVQTSYPSQTGPHLAKWALAADTNDSLSVATLHSKSQGSRLNRLLQTQSNPDANKLKKIGVFYVHGVTSGAVSRADLMNEPAIEFDVWSPVKSHPGYLSSKLWNPVAQEIQLSKIEWTTAEFRGLSLKTTTDFANRSADFVNFPIDAVYLWVDGGDADWQKRKAEHQPKKEDSYGDQAAGVYRFRNSNELKYAVRSLKQNAPWIRKVWIVTDNQLPAWLNEGHPDVEVVDHRDFIPKEFRPTFSSHVIASHLHRIKGVAEHFLYLNDDVFFSGRSVPENWFTPNGIALSQTGRAILPAKSSDRSTLVKDSRRTTVAALTEHKVSVSSLGLGHGPMPWTKEILKQIWKEFPKEMTATSSSKFRAASDMVPDWLVSQYGSHLQQAIRGEFHDGLYVAMHRRGNWRLINRLLFSKVPAHYVCLNDGTTDVLKGYVTEEMLAKRYRVLLESLFPHPSALEK